MMVTNMDGTTSLAPAVQNRFACPYDMPLLDWCKEMPQVVGPKSYSRLAKQVCANEDAKKRYLETMCQLTNGPLSADEILKIWDQADATIHKDVMAEADINWMGRNPLDEGVRKSYGAEYRRLRDWIPKRIKSVQEQITKLGVQCKAGCQDGAKDSCTYNGGEGERVCNANKWTACRKVGGNSAAAEESKMGCSYGEGRGGGALAAFGSLFALAALIARKRRKN
jgi:hypothetical protein